MVSLNSTDRPIALTAAEARPLETACADLGISTIAVVAPAGSSATLAVIAADIESMNAHRIGGLSYCA